MAGMKPGDQWACREHPRALGESVHHVEIMQFRPDGSVRVRWAEGPEEGLQEWLPRSVLLWPWDAEAERLEAQRRLAAVPSPARSRRPRSARAMSRSSRSALSGALQRVYAQAERPGDSPAGPVSVPGVLGPGIGVTARAGTRIDCVARRASDDSLMDIR
jgi:hypothetical protein